MCEIGVMGNSPNKNICYFGQGWPRKNVGKNNSMNWRDRNVVDSIFTTHRIAQHDTQPCFTTLVRVLKGGRSDGMWKVSARVGFVG